MRTQIVRQIAEAISAGVLEVDDPLPSTRELARELGVSRTTVTGCYQQLEGDGWIRGSQGAGTFVARRGSAGATGPQPPARPASERAPEPAFDLRPGGIDSATVSADQWRGLWRYATPSGVPPEPAGTPRLREALAHYLYSARGIVCESDEILVTAGTVEAVGLLVAALGWAGGKVALEDPGYPAIRRVLSRWNVETVSVPVDDGARIASHLDRSPGVAAAYLTPGHQYPLGYRLDTAERGRVLDWAERTGAVVIEDDYDGEFRYGVAPTMSMAAMRPLSNIVYIGTLSKVLDPGLRLAYLRVPPHLRDVVAQTREDLGATVATPIQDGVAAMLESGELSMHVARSRRLYGDRRKATLEALSRIPVVTGIRGIEAGLHLLVEFDDSIDMPYVVARCRSRGVAVESLADFYRDRPRINGLVIGYGRHTPTALRNAITILAECLAATPDG